MTGMVRSSPCVAIACGGTGGHLFPGLAVGEQLVQQGCRVTLVVSSKEVDQQAVLTAKDMRVLTLPAVGLVRGRLLAFASGFWRSYRVSGRDFVAHPPHAVLAMGGFTSAPPILAAKRAGARTFLHESNTIPGRANRWLSRVVDQAFVGFPATAGLLAGCRALHTGTPVRSQFQPRNAGDCRRALGLDPELPVVLVVGGSQGASGINRLVTQALPILGSTSQPWQWLHLTGTVDLDEVRRAYAASSVKAVVLPFLSEMDLALGAATVAISRAGASSLAELAATRVPGILIPYPAATDNHQLHNARAYADSGAALLLSQDTATPQALLSMVRQLMDHGAERVRMQSALASWHAPEAAAVIARAILTAIAAGAPDKTGVSLSHRPERGAGQNRSETLQVRAEPSFRLECQ